MTLEITFKQVCAIIKKDEPDLLKKVDQLFGLVLVCAPVLIGAELAALLPALAAKNELTKIGKDICNYSAKINKKVLDTFFVTKNQNPCSPLNGC